MAEPSPLDPTVDHETADALDAGMAAAFAPDSGPPLSADNSVLRALGAVLPEVPQVQLRDPDSGGHGPIVRPHSGEMPRGQDPGGRLQLHGEIARGGMGAVLRGRDVDLGREVAVKVLLEAHAGRTELLQRFVEEAQIAGQLQHPGIVPVYEFGQFTDRRPYFTMKLVKGQTLAKVRSVTPPARLLQIFEQVCQAMAYAHAHGVIHRDLKPSNVIVGNFGEVQVLDWGLAKVLKEGGVADEKKARQRAEDLTAIRTRRSEGSDVPGSGGTQTHAGSVMGTPAYMAPEQALGEVDRLDERADVFGLGAILCEILTGKPAYVGDDTDQVHRKAVRADLADAFARLDGCGIDAEVVALCKRCLAAEPAERPRDAGAVAEAVGAYQRGVAERLHRAELERAAAEAKAVEERKRHQVQLGLAAALVGLVLVGAGGGLVVQHQAAKQERERVQRAQELRGAVENALTQAEVLQQQARWPEARVLLEQALTRLDATGHADLRQRVEQALADLDLVDRLDAIRLQKAAVVEGKLDYAGADRAYAALFSRAGLSEETETAAAVANRLSRSAVRPQLVAALDDWAATTPDPRRWTWLLEAARRLDPHPLRDRLRDPKTWQDTQGLAKLASRARPEELTPRLAVALGWRLQSREAVTLLEQVQREHPADFWVNYTLGTLLGTRGTAEAAVGYFRAAVALRPTAAVAVTSLGTALHDSGKVEEGAAWYRRAIALDPRYALVHHNLAKSMKREGKLAECIALLRKTVELDPKLALAHLNLGVALAEAGRKDEAIEWYRKALAIDPRLGMAHNNLGLLLRAKGRVDEAIACHRQALAIDAANATAHNNLGLALLAKGQADEAIACFNKAIELDSGFAQAHGALGQSLLARGRYAEALASTRRALDLLPKDSPVRQGAMRQLESCRRMLDLESRLPAILRGEARPTDAPERLTLAEVCGRHKRLYAAAARFCAEAFAEQPDLRTGHRYNAACYAALAAAGQGGDAARLTATEKLALRRQALTWLRAELAESRHGAANGGRARKQWQEDPDLASLRDAAALKALSVEERQACERLWADVAALLAKAGRP